jgi:hypothetical protein
MSKKIYQNHNHKKSRCKFIYPSNGKEIVFWFYLYTPFLLGCLTIFLWMIISPLVGNDELGVGDNLTFSFAMFLASISGVLQIIKKASPGRNFNIIRGNKSIWIGMAWFLFFFALSLWLLWLAFEQ